MPLSDRPTSKTRVVSFHLDAQTGRRTPVITYVPKYKVAYNPLPAMDPNVKRRLDRIDLEYEQALQREREEREQQV